MNVIRTENAKVRPVSRSRGRGRGRDQRLNRQPVEESIIYTNYVPKYDSSASTCRPLINGIQTSSSARTPSNSRRYLGKSSSSSARIRSITSANQHPTTSTSTSAIESTVIMAITSGRGDARCEVGMAAIDVKFPHLIISQISDSQTYVNTLMKIHLFNPVEIIMPETMCGENDPRKKLFNTIKSKFDQIHITPMWRMHFNEENGLDRVKTHCANEFSTIELFVKEKYYALSATAALLKYVEHIQHIIYEPKSLKIEFQASQGATLIDVESAQSLELVSSYGPQRNHSLFSSLDRCVTPMGRRLLRSQILQPSCDDLAIKQRQASVSELVRNKNLHTILHPIVKQLLGADRLLGLSMRAVFVSECVEAAERNLNYILLLKTSLEIIPQLSSALDPATSPNFVKIRENLKDPRFRKMKDQILQIVQSDARSVNGFTSANMQRCFALKSGINDMLDVARQTYCELIDQTRILVESLAQEHNLPLAVACNASLGYHIRMDMPRRSNFNINELPNIFIEVQKKKNCLYMTTDLLMALSQQCKDARDELHIMSNCILETLITVLREDVGCLFQLSEDIAEMDLVMSLARISGIPDYVKPIFGESLRVVNSKHPIIDILGSELPRPNDIEASIAYNFRNITGPNMSGKTTYLKQVILLNIMAQIGCYVPATEAKIRIADRIFCRLCPSHEDIESNASAFIQEIKEIEYILQFVTPKSLIVLDEICRSTNVEEGSAIAFAICEKLLQSTAFIFNCTHFLYLTKLTELYHNVVNHYFECVPNELDKWGLKYTHKLRSGVTDVENYGISAASAARMPKSVIEKAKSLVEEISKEIKPLPLAKAPELSWEKDCYACVSKIMDLIISHQYTSENVQLAIEPLRSKKNVESSQKEMNPLINRILQSNLQENGIGNLQKNLNLLQTKTTLNPNLSNVLQSNPGASNPIRMNDGSLIIYEINAASNILRNKTGNFSGHQSSIESSNVLQSQKGALNVHQIDIMGYNNDLQSNGNPQDKNQMKIYAADRLKLYEAELKKSSYQSYFQESGYQSHFEDSGHKFNLQQPEHQLNLQQSDQQSNLQQSRHQFNFQQSDQQPVIQKSDYHQMELIASNNLNLHQSQLQRSNQPSTSANKNYKTFHQQKNVLVEVPDQKSPFKVPIPIKPTSSYHIDMAKVKRTREQNISPTGTDISNFSFFKNGKSPSTCSGLKKLRPFNKSLSGVQNSSLFEFGFLKEKNDSEKRSSDLHNFQISDSQDENKSHSRVENTNSSNLSFLKEPNSNNISTNLKTSKRSWQTDLDDSTKISQSLNFSCSHTSVSGNSIKKEMESRSIFSKRSKLDSNEGNNEASLNSLNVKQQESLSSFNTANLSFSLGLSGRPSQNTMSMPSSQNKEKSPNVHESQVQAAIQVSKASSNFSFIANKEEDFLKKNQDTKVTSPHEYSVSDFESILDEDTEDSASASDDSSEIVVLNHHFDNDTVTISSVDTCKAANSARRKEDEIFNQIDNANDQEIFFQKLFNSPLSMEFSAELCSCNYKSTPKK